MTQPPPTARDIIQHLNLAPHPEGGHYRQTWASSTHITDARQDRALATCIYFLLGSGERSHWHKVDADEIWLWHAGDPLRVLTAATSEGPATETTLGPDLLAHHVPQHLVPKDEWQATLAPQAGGIGWSLVSCVVAPGFQFDGFTLATPDFDIPRAPKVP